MKLGVCVSGQGTNLRNLVERGFDVVAVATNRPSCAGAAYARQLCGDGHSNRCGSHHAGQLAAS